MNANLTVSTLSFNQIFSDKAGSLRREVSRGVTLPTEMKVAHTDYKDSATKLQGKRSLVRFDRYIELSDDSIAPVSAYVVVTHPNDSAVTSTDILAVVECLVNTLQEDDTGLDLMDEIFVNKEQ
jgi:hypothetical protein